MPKTPFVMLSACLCRDSFVFIRLLLCIGSALSLPGLLLAQSDTKAARSSVPSIILTTEGTVEISPSGTTEWQAARASQILGFGDRLRTARQSRATVRLADYSVLRVNELTTLQILPPANQGKRLQLDLKNGSIFFFSRERPEEIEFKTPLASGAIRGTEFLLDAVESDKTLLALFDGEVVIRNESGELTLASGEEATVTAGHPPAKTAMIDAVSKIQWALYYPAILNPADLELTPEEEAILKDSLAAYRSGDLLAALEKLPANPLSGASQLYAAALQISVGQISAGEKALALQTNSPVARALHEMIATVQGRTLDGKTTPETASEWMARSYSHQARSELEGALEAAREATHLAPDFGFAWVRLAEMEFSFGRTAAAMKALDKGLSLSPANAQGIALRGFILLAQNRPADALQAFEQAILTDGALANAWLGRGLTRIRMADDEGGRKDLETAAAIEPQRAILRSYLAKTYGYVGDEQRAAKDFRLAKQLDPLDPTAWLYSALFNQQQNRINDAVRDLEKSQELNDNRSLFRSELLLDQDRAVRGANLASIYRDAGMLDVGIREASRAVNNDYTDYSAHLFLANSYAALNDPKRFNLRYETPRVNEALLSFLLAPIGGEPLSFNHAAQDRVYLIEEKKWGINSLTEYTSNGDWVEYGTHYGAFGNTAYAFDTFYRSDNGQRPNNELEQLEFLAQFKQQLTLQDSIFVHAGYYNAEGGDIAQYYNQAAAKPALRVEENHEPNILVGYHREWSPGVHTLFLAGRLDNSVEFSSPSQSMLFFRQSQGALNQILIDPLFSLDYSRDMVAYTTELQQIWQTPRHTFIVGGRYQTGSIEATSDLTRPVDTRITQSIESDLQRVSLYAYDHWQIFDPLRLTLGVGYDHLEYPLNALSAPLLSGEEEVDLVSPKVGLEYTPWKGGFFRAMYSKALNGFSSENSIRLEPTQIAGYAQAFRSLTPESNSEIGLTAGTEFSTWAVGFEQKFPTGTYAGIDAEWRDSDASRVVGVLTNSHPIIRVPDQASSTREDLDYTEKSLVVNLNQLLSTEWSIGTRYRISEAELTGRFTDVSASVPGASLINQDKTAVLHQLDFLISYNHPSGFFSQWDSLWSAQSNSGYSPDLPGDDFWMHSIFVGYRFARRIAEVRIGIVNLTDQDYQLNPLNFYAELPRERMTTVRLKLNF